MGIIKTGITICLDDGTEWIGVPNNGWRRSSGEHMTDEEMECRLTAKNNVKTVKKC